MASFDPSKEVPSTVTPVSLEEARASLSVVIPADWAGNVLLYVLALLWVECKRGQAVIQHNFGNLAAGGYSKGVDVAWWTGAHWRPGWYESPPTERYAALHEKMLRGEAPSAFRAYQTREKGVAGFVGLLRDARFRGVIQAARNDDPEAFVQALHDSGYSKDYGAAHVPTFRSLVAELRGSDPGVAPGPKPGETGSGLLVAAAVAGVAVLLTRGRKAPVNYGNKAKRRRA
jgi:hypothetical protein